MQIQIDQASVFFCDNLCGTMEPFSNTSVLVKFTPQHAIPYCRTIPVVVHNQVGFTIVCVLTFLSVLCGRNLCLFTSLEQAFLRFKFQVGKPCKV